MHRSRYFLNVQSSACGQAWLDALDIQGINNARAISQKFGFPDQLARVLSARDVDESEAVALSIQHCAHLCLIQKFYGYAIRSRAHRESYSEARESCSFW